jgi:hypothetical protein
MFANISRMKKSLPHRAGLEVAAMPLTKHISQAF